MPTRGRRLIERSRRQQLHRIRAAAGTSPRDGGRSREHRQWARWKRERRSAPGAPLVLVHHSIMAGRGTPSSIKLVFHVKHRGEAREVRFCGSGGREQAVAWPGCRCAEAGERGTGPVARAPDRSLPLTVTVGPGAIPTSASPSAGHRSGLPPGGSLTTVAPPTATKGAAHSAVTAGGPNPLATTRSTPPRSLGSWPSSSARPVTTSTASANRRRATASSRNAVRREPASTRTHVAAGPPQGQDQTGQAGATAQVQAPPRRRGAFSACRLQCIGEAEGVADVGWK